MGLVTKTPEEELIRLINTANGVDIELKDVVLEVQDVPTVTSSYSQILSVSDAGDNVYHERGDGVIWVKRDLTALFRQLTPTLVVDDQIAYGDILDIVFKKYGLGEYTEKDFSLELLSQVVEFNNMAQTNIVFTALDSSLGWRGQFAIRCKNKAFDISTILKETTVEKPRYVENSSGEAIALPLLTRSFIFDQGDFTSTQVGDIIDEDDLDLYLDCLDEFYEKGGELKSLLAPALAGKQVAEITSIVYGVNTLRCISLDTGAIAGHVGNVIITTY